MTRATESAAECVTAQPEALLRAYASSSATLRETKTSFTFLIGNRAYKIRKSLDLPVLRRETLQERREYCEQDVLNNSDLAPGVYLGVVPIKQAADGVRFGGEGRTIDYAIEMTRLPDGQMLTELLARGSVSMGQIQSIATTIASFHHEAACDAMVAYYGRPSVVLRSFESTVETVRDQLSRSTYREFLQRGGRWVTRNSDLLWERVRSGRIRDGHGDLHAGNICLLPSSVVAYDRLYSLPYRCGDVAADIAFLSMDLERYGFRKLSSELARSYISSTGDTGIAHVLRFYTMHRALIRAGATLSTSCGSPTRSRSGLRQDVASFADLAVSLLDELD